MEDVRFDLQLFFFWVWVDGVALGVVELFLVGCLYNSWTFLSFPTSVRIRFCVYANIFPTFVPTNYPCNTQN